MGLRFRKSVKLAPGIRMNFSGSGVSWTLGPRGASVSVGSRGTFLNSGIPGTGLSSRTQLSGGSGREQVRSALKDIASSAPARTSVSIKVSVEDNGELVFRDETGTPIAQWLIDKARRQHGTAIKGLIQSACDKVNGEVEALGEIHLNSPSPHQPPTYQKRNFEQPKPVPPALIQKGFWDKILKSRWAAKELQNTLALEKFASDTKDWEAQLAAHKEKEERVRDFIERQILESEEAMELHLAASLQSVQWPRETTVSFDVAADGSSVTLDVDLPEIEDLPARTASVPSRGYRLSVKEMGPTQKQKLYMAHVHGVGFRVIAETFAALPTVQRVTLSAYTQRPNKATGQVADDYLYSVRVGRAEWSQINFAGLAALDVIEALERFELRRKMTKTGVFTAIEPFSEGMRQPS